MVSLLAAFCAAAFLLLSLPDPAVARGPQKLSVEDVVVMTANGAHVFHSEIAGTAEEQAVGLMFRKTLAPDAAMLFDFRPRQPVYMWMRNTHVSLDMIFIDVDGRVTRIAEKTVPFSETIIRSGAPVAAVLEVVAGTARRIGLKPGDRVRHRIFKSR